MIREPVNHAAMPTPVCIHCDAMRLEVAELRKTLGLSGKASDQLALQRAYKLAPAEARLIQALYDAAGKVVPNYTLAQIVVSDGALYDGSDALKVHVSNARAKIGFAAIETVTGSGYAMTDTGRALVYTALKVAAPLREIAA